MVKFDFITNDRFRTSLEDDYRELETVMSAGAWKSAHVLAGSIVEAVLIDTLISLGISSMSNDDLLKKSLDIITLDAKNQNVLSQKAYDLSSVIRQYRNLIHPGRVYRLNETVDKEGAIIAHALVSLIVGEVAEKKKQTYGYTAEQIVTKVTSDLTAQSILVHILKKTNPYEIERLLLSVLPKMYVELDASSCFLGNADYIANEQTRSALQMCYREAFQIVSADVKQKAVQKVVKCLQEEAGHLAYIYETRFFMGSDLAYLSEEDASVVKTHLLSRLDNADAPTLEALKGIGPFLTKAEIHSLLHKLVVLTAFTQTSDDRYEALADVFSYKIGLLSNEAIQWLEEPAARYKQFYSDKRMYQVVKMIDRFLEHYLDETDPFADE